MDAGKDMPGAASDSIFSMLNPPNSMLPPPPRMSGHAKETKSHKQTKVRMLLLTALLTKCMLHQSCLFCMCILFSLKEKKEKKEKKHKRHKASPEPADEADLAYDSSSKRCSCYTGYRACM